MTGSRIDHRPLWVCLLLLLATVGAYWPVFHCQFLNLDDPDYVTENLVVRRGLCLNGLAWGFTTEHAGNWHPLTWFSHMLDCQLFDLNPAAHHATNLLFHTINSLLLFGLFRRMTRALWRSALAAALFAVHPIHVESVAWISERKDVLSTFFGLLALWAYVAFAKSRAEVNPKAETRGPKEGRNPKAKIPIARAQIARGAATEHASRITHHTSRFYLLSLLLFTLGLMSKPMVVTLPFVLLLLDFWPLQRLRLSTIRSQLPIFLEKLPFLALSLSSCVITFLAQRNAGAVFELTALPLGTRFANAAVAYVLYVRKILWPNDLAICYPLVQWQPWQIWGAIVLMLLVSLCALRAATQRPYLTMGWLWFSGTLIPVIGLVQVGSQSMADRYAYIPSIGLLVALTWGGYDQLRRWRASALILGGLSASLLLACALVTLQQLQHWRDSTSLFTRALACNNQNDLAHDRLGEALLRQHKLTEAKPHFLSALQLAPRFPEARYGLGLVLQAEGHPAETVAQWRTAIQLKPAWIAAVNNLAWLLATCSESSVRNPSEAVRLAEQASAGEPNNASFSDTLGAAYAAAGRSAEAIAACQRAILLAQRFGQTNAADRFRSRLELYVAGKSYSEP